MRSNTLCPIHLLFDESEFTVRASSFQLIQAQHQANAVSALHRPSDPIVVFVIIKYQHRLL